MDLKKIKKRLPRSLWSLAMTRRFFCRGCLKGVIARSPASGETTKQSYNDGNDKNNKRRGFWTTSFRTRCKKNKGITLLEVMVAMTIFSVGFLCLLPMIVTAIKGNEFAEDYTKATNFNQTKAEQLKSTHSFLPNDSTSGTEAVENMTRSWKVIRDVTLSHYYNITVVTSWHSDDGRAHQCSLFSGESTTE